MSQVDLEKRLASSESARVMAEEQLASLQVHLTKVGVHRMLEYGRENVIAWYDRLPVVSVCV